MEIVEIDWLDHHLQIDITHIQPSFVGLSSAFVVAGTSVLIFILTQKRSKNEFEILFPNWLQAQSTGQPQ